MRKLARAFLAFGLISARDCDAALRAGREEFGAAGARAAGRQAETRRVGVKPEIAPSGPVLVYVDLNRQRATVYRNGVRIGVSTISSGKDGYETPTGVFTILEKNEDHHSRTYDDAPMPFQQRLTWMGVAMHAGNLPGFPASHGCVRLPMEFAKQLFEVTPMGGHGRHRRRPRRSRQAPRGGRARAGDGGRHHGACDAAVAGRAVHLEAGRFADRPGVDHHLDQGPAGRRAAQWRRDRPRPCGRRATNRPTAGDDLRPVAPSLSGSRSALPTSPAIRRDHLDRARRADAAARGLRDRTCAR